MRPTPLAFVVATVVILTGSRADARGIVRVRAGETAPFVDAQRRTWSADAGFRGGRVVRLADAPVWSWVEAGLYRSTREGASGYELAVPNGRYVVSLHFVEHDPAVTRAGQRVFAVAVEGTRTGAIDVWEQAGGHHVPLVHVVSVEVRDGAVTIAFEASRGEPTIAAIEIVPAAKRQPPRVSGTVVEDFGRFVEDGALARAGRTDDHSGPVIPRLERAADGTVGLRLGYRVDAYLPYGNQARFELPLATPVALAGARSVRFVVVPDGSGREAAVQLTDARGRIVTVPLALDGHDPRVVTASLEHASSWGHPTAKDPGFEGPVTAVTFLVRAAPKAALGAGSVWFGSIVASMAAVALPKPPPAYDTNTTPEVLRLDGFETYRANEELWLRYGPTSHANPSRLSLARGVGKGRQSLRLDYTFDKRQYSGFVTFRELDLRPYTAFRFWLRPDGSGNRLRVFFALGQIHEFQVPLDGHEPRVVEVPFQEFLGPKARVNGTIELGFWALRSGDSTGGTIHLDDIELVRDERFAPGPAPKPAPAAIPGDRVTRIDCGSDRDVVDRDGQTWLADRGFQFGRVHVLNAGEVEHYPEPYAVVHHTFRVGMEGYAFAVPNGRYAVKLILGENWLGARVPGRRVCAMRVGDVSFGDVDIIAETKERFVPLVKTAEVEVTNGVLELGFVDKANHCKLDALVIEPKPRLRPAAARP